MNIVFDLMGSGDTLFIEKIDSIDLVGSEKVHRKVIVFDTVGSQKYIVLQRGQFSLWGPYNGHFKEKRPVFPMGTLQLSYLSEELQIPYFC